MSQRLEGLNRHASTHAAGVVIGDGPLKRYVPLYKIGDDVVIRAGAVIAGEGIERKLVGFEMYERGIARHGYPVLLAEDDAEPTEERQQHEHGGECA